MHAYPSVEGPGQGLPALAYADADNYPADRHDGVHGMIHAAEPNVTHGRKWQRWRTTFAPTGETT